MLGTGLHVVSSTLFYSFSLSSKKMASNIMQVSKHADANVWPMHCKSRVLMYVLNVLALVAALRNAMHT